MAQPSDNRAREEILRHLAQFGVSDKDARRTDRRRPPSRERGNRFDVVLDLHGMTADEAAQRLAAAVRRAGETGRRTLLVIHGIGLHSAPGQGPVLRDLVRTMLDHECAPRIRGYHAAPPRDGGDGATVVRLR